MTVASNTPFDQYSATSSQTVFNYTFEIVEETDLLVYQRAASSDPDDSADILTLTTEYTVTGVGDTNGGTIVLVTGATTGDIITIKQNVPVERDTSFTPGGILRAENLNIEYDNLTLIAQLTRFNEQSRMLSYFNSAVVTPTTDTIIPVLSALEGWRMNSAGTAIEAISIPDGGFAPASASYITLDDESSELPNSAFLYNLGNASTSGMGIPAGTTAQRVVPVAPNISMRFNTDLGFIEAYIGGSWVEIPSSSAGLFLPLAGGTMTGTIDMGSNPIENLPAPVNPNDAVRKAYADLFLPLTGGTMSGAINMGSQLINDVLDPVSAQDAATKNYVDTAIGGSAGGSNTQIQYNNLGAFGGDSGFTTDGAGNIVIVGSLNIDNLQINGNSIVSTDAAGDINLTPDTTGNLVLDGLNWPQADGTVGQILSTDGAGQLSWQDDSAGNPGGSNTQIQYNSAGLFAGDSGFTTDGVGNVSLVSIDIGSTTPITGFINDDTMATASTSNASSSTAIVNYIASQVAGSGGLQSFQIFTTGTAATYTTPGGITSILVEVLGGGGGGGGVAASGAGAAFAGGGGAGGYARLFIATAASSYTYTVGAGGAGGTAGANPGTTGGTTSFGASLQATGGAGGTGRTGAAAAAIVDGGTGGVGSSGDFNSGGMPAMFGVATSGAAAGYSGSGASSIYGGGGRGSQSATAGTNAQNYGSGGSGAATGTATNRAGGNGSTGLIIVWEFA